MRIGLALGIEGMKYHPSERRPALRGELTLTLQIAPRVQIGPEVAYTRTKDDISALDVAIAGRVRVSSGNDKGAEVLVRAASGLAYLSTYDRPDGEGLKPDQLAAMAGVAPLVAWHPRSDEYAASRSKARRLNQEAKMMHACEAWDSVVALGLDSRQLPEVAELEGKCGKPMTLEQRRAARSALLRLRDYYREQAGKPGPALEGGVYGVVRFTDDWVSWSLGLRFGVTL